MIRLASSVLAAGLCLVLGFVLGALTMDWNHRDSRTDHRRARP